MRAEEPELASKFDVFTRLVRGDGGPAPESQLLSGGAWREAAFARQRLRRHLLILGTVILSLLTAVVVLGFS